MNYVFLPKLSSTLTRKKHPISLKLFKMKVVVCIERATPCPKVVRDKAAF